MFLFNKKIITFIIIDIIINAMKDYKSIISIFYVSLFFGGMMFLSLYDKNIPMSIPLFGGLTIFALSVGFTSRFERHEEKEEMLKERIDELEQQIKELKK